MECTVCGKGREEVVRLIGGPMLELDAESAVQLMVCDECVGAVAEALSGAPAASAGDDGERSGMCCSFCGKHHREVDNLVLCARFYRVGDQIERVVHYTFFFAVYADRDPQLLAEVSICNECIDLCRQVLAEQGAAP